MGLHPEFLSGISAEFFSLLNFNTLHHVHMKVSAGYPFRRTSVTKKSFPLLHMLNSSIYLDNI